MTLKPAYNYSIIVIDAMHNYFPPAINSNVEKSFPSGFNSLKALGAAHLTSSFKNIIISGGDSLNTRDPFPKLIFMNLGRGFHLRPLTPANLAADAAPLDSQSPVIL
jgi:hypothetical protein